jgi:drug/metabolite transporter (DMT)-like permease
MSRIKADLMLFITALIWGSVFAIQRIASQTAGVFPFNATRFLLGALILLCVVRFRWKPQGKQWLWIVLAGTLLLAASAFQQAGLRTTTAANAGFITGAYVVVIPFILSIFLKQHISWRAWLAAGMTAVGVYMLSAGSELHLNPGDALELAGTFMWALHVIIVGKAMQKMDVMTFAIGQYLVVGLLGLIPALTLERSAISGLPGMWWAVIYAGVLSIAVGFTLQASAQKVAPPTDAAILLSLEAAFAALFGWWWLGESLQPLQWLGCAVILAAILISQIHPEASPTA